MNEQYTDVVSSDPYHSGPDAIALDHDRVARLGEYLKSLATPGVNGQALFEVH